MRIAEVVAAVAAQVVGEPLVVCSLGSGRRAWESVDPGWLTYSASDPMGAGPGLALGLALQRPEDEVVLIEGDGDLAMSLGSLLTVADAAPANLRALVVRNGRYDTGGGTPLAGGRGPGFAALAAEAGWRWTHAVVAADEVGAAVAAWAEAPGPAMLEAVVEPAAGGYPPAPRWSPAEERAFYDRRRDERDAAAGRPLLGAPATSHPDAGAMSVADALVDVGVTTVASLPDSWLRPLLDEVDADPRLRHVRVTREDEAIAVAAGVALGGGFGAVVCQNAGLLLSTNVLAAYVHLHRFPLVVVAADRGDVDDDQYYQLYKHQVTAGVLSAVGLEVHRVAAPPLAPAVAAVAVQARLARRPGVVLASRAALVDLGGTSTDRLA